MIFPLVTSSPYGIFETISSQLSVNEYDLPSGDIVTKIIINQEPPYSVILRRLLINSIQMALSHYAFKFINQYIRDASLF